MATNNILDLPRDQFLASLNELAAQGVNTDELMRQYRRANSPFSGLFDWAINSERNIANEGRTTTGAGLFSKEAGTTGMDALASTRIEPANFIAGLLSDAAFRADAPAAALKGLIPPSDMQMEALGLAGFAQLGGAAMPKPRGALGANSLRGGGGPEVAIHRSAQDFRDIDLSKSADGTFWMASPQANWDNIVTTGKGFEHQFEISPSAKLATWDDIDRYSVGELQNMGYDGVRMDDGAGDVTYQVWNTDVLRRQQSLPAARNEAERMARQILEMRAAGRAGEVTDAMMAQADPQYMFNNTPLPMDEASRMARAGEMGLLDDQYHATTSDFQAFMPSETGLSGRGIYTGDYPTDIADYATKGGSNQGLNVIPLSAPAGSRYARNIDWQRTLDADTEFPYNATAEETIAGFKRAADTMSQQGYAGVHNQAGERVTFNPSSLRSRFARFDPEFSHLANLNAANASPLAGILAMPNEEERNRQLGLLFGGYR